ncbi:hypothetical protein BP6252_06551 [Coleophoma cylindrospora]|uniref:Zn(2)-C6 fungal-type domain-containing protein n=1 Tax=Coleophoma cylindrospora TaxID=1849047 RepID=A0A3D8RMY1_9HELO|nr:hypothetical protein BP6252_06551 [Coleophoma cylindrospora]
MTALRKACRNCTTSKRKCVVQLPKCTRCAQKGLGCTYDLEPLKAPTRPPLDKDSSGYCIMKTFKSPASSIDPAICRPGNEGTLEFVRLGYLSVPGLVRAGKPAVFVHPKLQLHDSYNHFAALGEAGKGGLSYESFKSLIEINVKTVPVREALTALQALLVYLATFLFSSSQVDQSRAENYLNVLSEWTQNLLESARARMPQHQSPWQEWLFGESVRRAIILSNMLSLLLYSFRYGYCSRWLFLESLPFDRRAGLWMAESPQAWIAAARVRTGEEVGERLNSLHEFAESCDGSDPDFGGDMFLALLTLGHNGARRNHERRPGGN